MSPDGGRGPAHPRRDGHRGRRPPRRARQLALPLPTATGRRTGRPWAATGSTNCRHVTPAAARPHLRRRSPAVAGAGRGAERSTGAAAGPVSGESAAAVRAVPAAVGRADQPTPPPDPSCAAAPQRSPVAVLRPCLPRLLAGRGHRAARPLPPSGRDPVAPPRTRGRAARGRHGGDPPRDPAPPARGAARPAHGACRPRVNPTRQRGPPARRDGADAGPHDARQHDARQHDVRRHDTASSTTRPRITHRRPAPPSGDDPS